MVLCQLDVVSLDLCVLVKEFHLMFVETVALHVTLEKMYHEHAGFSVLLSVCLFFLINLPLEREIIFNTSFLTKAFFQSLNQSFTVGKSYVIKHFSLVLEYL